jgi:HEPN domain-containing protein
MAMTKEEVVTFWTDKAKDELETATIMFNSAKYLYTGFMCHQCIEKALKAYYIYLNDKRQPHQHNLEALADMTNLLDKFDDSQKEILKKLKPLYIETRYEDEKNVIAELLTKSYCKDLLSETEVMLNWIVELMKSPEDTQPQ